MRRDERILGPIAGNGTAQHAAIGSVTRLAHWRTNAGISFFWIFPKSETPAWLRDVRRRRSRCTLVYRIGARLFVLSG